PEAPALPKPAENAHRWRRQTGAEGGDRWSCERHLQGIRQALAEPGADLTDPALGAAQPLGDLLSVSTLAYEVDDRPLAGAPRVETALQGVGDHGGVIGRGVVIDDVRSRLLAPAIASVSALRAGAHASLIPGDAG